MIVDVMNQLADGRGLRNEEDGFYYDHLRRPDGCHDAMKIRSMVGLIPLYACLVLDDKKLQKLPDFKKRLKWFLEYEKGFATHVRETPIPRPLSNKFFLLIKDYERSSRRRRILSFACHSHSLSIGTRSRLDILPDLRQHSQKVTIIFFERYILFHDVG